MRRQASKDDVSSPASTGQRSLPTRSGSKLGSSKQGSMRRQVQQGSWRGRKLADGPEVVQEDDEDEAGMRNMDWQDVRREGVVEDVGDEGIGQPFNVAVSLTNGPRI